MLVNPPAKINIGLHVVSQRADGYHNLETVFYPIGLADTLEVKVLEHSNAPYLFQQVGKKIDGPSEDNLIIRVYESLRKEFDLPQLDIYLDKKIPTGAGLGGGSSDAASMMKLLVEAYDLPLTEEEMCNRLSRFGADCPFFVKASPCYATGIGDEFAPLKLSLKGWYIALVKPQVSVSTKEAYDLVVPQVSGLYLPDVLSRPVDEWKGLVRNDFERSVFAHHPQISAIKETLYDMGATYASMSGSGSAVFGLFRKRPYGLKKVFSDCFCYQAQLLL